MAEFTSDHFHQNLIKPSFPIFDHHVFDQDITQYSVINPNSNTSTTTTSNNNNNVMDNSTLVNFQTFLPFSSDNFFSNPNSEYLLAQNFQGNNNLSCNTNSCASQKPIIISNKSGIVNYEYSNESKKRKNSFNGSESSSGISSPLSETGISMIKTRNNGSGKGKRVKNNNNNNNNNEKEELDQKLKDVVHVRARRGQATDSHSLAERVRRGKINERLKCLQDIVPGCYKTMGMAVMLDEIINYVQSLQNQVEFLSMKLTAASSFYDFNSETDAVEKLQRAKANEAKEIERLIREEYGGFSCFHSNWPL